MKIKGYRPHAVLIIGIMWIAAGAASAQVQQMEPSFDVSLQLIVGSNDGTRGEIPSELSGVTKQIRSSFGFSNYRVAGTYLARVGNRGSFDYKVKGDIGDGTPATPQTYLDWSMQDLKVLPTTNGQTGYQADSLRFAAKVPVQVPAPRDDTGRSLPVFTYESIGLTVNRFGLSSGSPTLIGTLNLPGSSGTVFLVMTVRPAI